MDVELEEWLEPVALGINLSYEALAAIIEKHESPSLGTASAVRAIGGVASFGFEAVAQTTDADGLTATESLTLERLLAADLALDWTKQERMLGFSTVWDDG